MSLKIRIKKLEKALHMEDPLKGATELVRAAIEYGIVPPVIDFEEEVRKCAKAGLTLSGVMGAIINEIHESSEGLPPLPCQRTNE